MLNKMAIFEQVTLVKKKHECGMGPSCPSDFFFSLENATRTFNLRSNEPSRDILGPLDQYDYS
jgi:hypothetical protein